jgi:homoserine O-acetyltransferase
LIWGCSGGAALTWLWGIEYPEFMDALMPFAVLPKRNTGRQALYKELLIHSIQSDPQWNDGNYQTSLHGWEIARNITFMMGGGVAQFERFIPDFEAAIRSIHLPDKSVRDPNDILYRLIASRSFDPEPKLKEIKAKVLAVNFSDDEMYREDTHDLERLIKNVKNGRTISYPVTASTWGHLTINRPNIWSQLIAEFMKEIESKLKS